MRSCRLLGTALLLAIAALAQINRGVIQGVVTDPQGAVVPGVEVVITSTDTNVATATKTNSTGFYRVVDLVPGTFRAHFSAPGFATIEMANIQVQAGVETRNDVTLKVDATRQTVQVTSEAPLIESGASNFSTTIQQTLIEDTPVAGRDLQQLVFLVPGINNVGGPPGANFGFNSAYGTFPDPTNTLGSNVAVNGGQAGANAWYLDGNLNSSSFAENVVINPVPDAVQEFQSVTNSFAAEYGRTGGGVFNVVLKSGGNAFHGNVYEFLRNDATNARNPFTSIDSSGNLIKDRQLRFNNFGGTFGGPVWIPKLYNGRNRTFFFFSMDQTVLHLYGNQVFTVPTPLMRQGIFTEDPNVVSNGLFNPYSTVGPDANGLFHRTPLAGGQIPTNMLDPIAMHYVNSFPMPNYNDPLVSCPQSASGNYKVCNNFIGGVGSSYNPRKISLKFDHEIRSNNHLFAEWLTSPTPYQNYRVPWTGASFPWSQVGWGSTYSYDMSNNIISLGDNYLVTPTLVNEFRASFSRQFITTHPSQPYPDSITDQTATAKLLQAAQIPLSPYFPVPSININGAEGGYMSIGPTAWVNMNTGAEAYTILDNVTKTIGAHTLKTGFIYRLDHTSYESGFPTGFNFNGNLTQDPISNTGGNGLAQFEMGAVSSNGRDSSTGVMWNPYESFRYWGAFFQDDFRVTRNLTLNIGLRYEVYGLFSVRTQNASSFCLSCPNDTTGLPGKVIYQGTPDMPTGPIAPANKNDWAPRFNFAWSPFKDHKTVIRGGYDIFYTNALTLINSPGQSAANAPGWNQEFDWRGSFNPSQCAPFLGQCPAFQLSDPNTNKADLTTPPMSSGFPAARKDPLLGDFIQFFTPPSHDPMVQTWNFEIERELPGNMMLDVGYVGNHGTHLVGESFQQFNFVPTSEVLQYKNQLNTVVPITSVYSGKTAAALQQIWGSDSLPLSTLLSPYPAYGAIQNNTGFEGASIYHGLNVRVQKRYSSGFTFVAAYTFSKLITNPMVANMASMLVDPIHWTRAGGLGGRAGSVSGAVTGGGFQDPNNKDADRAVGSSDIPHMFNLAASYELPFGRGKAFLNSNRAMDLLLGGWQLSGNFNAQSGLPLSITCPGNQITSRCNIIGNPNMPDGRSKQDRIADWINPAAFQPPFGGDQNFWANYNATDPRAWQFGNAGIRLPYLRGPGFWNLDSSLFKKFHIDEQRYFELRWEMFNALNHMNLANPNTNFCLPANADGSTDLVHQAGCQFGRITNIQTDPRSMEFSVKFFF